MENLVISGCNGTSNILVLSPNCTSERAEKAQILSNVRFEHNAVFEDAHIIEAASLCSELEIVGVVFLRNRCVGTRCVALGARNTLINVYLVNNQGSNETLPYSSFFFGSTGSETNVTEVTSLNNTIRSFYVSNGDLRIRDSHFDGNRRNQSEGTRDSSIGGGVLFSNHSSISLSNTTMERNSAFNGGALFTWSSNLTIWDCRFRENDAMEGNGGALYGHHNSSFDIFSSVFSKNCGYSGAGLYSNYTASVNMVNIRVLENHSSQSSAVLISNGTTSIRTSEFLQNTASRGGGALWITSAKLSLRNSTFIGNDAGFGSACVFQENATVHASTLLFENNRARIQGGSLHLSMGIHMRLRHSVFRNNSCMGDGGAIFTTLESEAFLTRVEFLNNTSGTYGGALEIWAGNFSGTHLTFVRNRATSYGGAISFYEANNVTVSRSFFEGNIAENAGAAQFLATLSGYVDRCTFVRNSGKEGGGGAVRAQNSNMTISNTAFHANAANMGGSLDFTDQCNSTIVDSSFENNMAERRGGAINIHSRCSLILFNSSFSSV